MSDSKQKKEKQIITAITPLDTGCAFEDIFYALATKTSTNKYISFLDSSLVPNRFSTYSYLAWEPEFVLKSSGIRNEIMDLQTGERKEIRSHPLEFLDQILKNNIFSDAENIYFDDLNTKNETSVGQKSGFSQKQGGGQKSYISCGQSISKKSCISCEQGIGPKSDVHLDRDICKKVKDEAGEIISPDYRGGFIGYFSYDLKNYIEKLPAKAKKDLNGASILSLLLFKIFGF